VARRATLIKQLRAESTNTLVLDAGDSLLNDQEPALGTRGASSIETLNRLGYSALGIGMKDLSALSLDELRQRIGEAQFPVLSANAVIKSSGELLTKPYVILPVADHRIAILGLTDAGEGAEVRAQDPLEAVRRYVPQLLRQADVIILLSHAGLAADQEIAQQVPGIDLVISGGLKTSQEPVAVSGALIMHAESPTLGNAGKAVGVGRFSFDATGRLTRHTWERVRLAPEIADDPEMTNWLAGQ
jgi:2',3'-cyclic-nucleotide 2'-phosphodiesterase (5'-nucleotidase family)